MTDEEYRAAQGETVLCPTCSHVVAGVYVRVFHPLDRPCTVGQLVIVEA